jgi:hypothetical protein
MDERTRVVSDDKRLIPECGPVHWAHRESERDWHYCKYCYRDVPTFRLAEGQIGWGTPTGVMRCCWECGAGLEILWPTEEESA